MRAVSHARLTIVLLLTTLSAVSGICLSGFSKNNIQAPARASTELLQLQTAQALSAMELQSWWKHLGSRASPEVLIAHGLNLLLVGLIIVLLRRSGHFREDFFAKAFRCSPLAVSITTLQEGRYLDVNQSFLQMFGYERGDVIGRTASELGIWVEQNDRARMIDQLSTSRLSRGLTTRMRTRSGDTRQTRVSAELIDVEGLSCVLAVTQDVTESERLENQLRQAQRMSAVGRLAGGIAHDFNNILTVIIGYAELASYRLGTGHGVSRHLNEIKLAGERAATLTRQLLAFSRQQVLYPRILDLNGVINNLTQMLLRMIGEDISLSFRSGSVGPIKADPGQIEQILMNLVVNARDAMPNGGTIAIETSTVDLGEGYIDSHLSVRPGRYVMMSVSDTGCGMDEKTVSQIFEPFFTTKAPGRGTGLGLSTVYGVVKQSDGYIWVYSEVGRGTTFKVYFPEQPHPAERVADPLPSEPIPGKETVLVVEDDEALRKLIVSLLAGSGYNVLEAANGEVAIRLAQDHSDSIDLLLTDMLMPGMSGVELSSRLKQQRPGLKVLVMSGYAGDLIARYRVVENEINLLEKPFTRHGLLSKVRTALQ